ncbi:hypothetical protein [uncultured Dokdonia sp.]|uniref:hypothetical protein n=1 Tax=uncultured Dokdonia sp. TaxID=575653 RepID=UPI0030EB4D5C|tara:strand:+ start:74698 stop:75195 length:498 start_codon:yes stop_codon:yes gene_type:complete
MKKYLLSSLIAAVLLTSCDNNLRFSASTDHLPSVDEVSLTVVGMLERESFVFTISEVSFLNAFQAKARTLGLQLVPSSLKVIEMKGNKYLRVFSNDNYVSTFALELDESGVYSTGATMCTSQTTFGEACLPDGMQCIKFVDEFGDTSEADCIRSTTLRDQLAFNN